MAIEGQVRVKCDAKVLDRSYSDVTGQLGDELPHSKQDKHVFFRIDQTVVSATALRNMFEILSNFA